MGFSIYELFGIDPAGALTLADAGYLLLIPLWAAALIAHPARSRRGIDRVGTSVDAVTIVTVAATLTIAYVLQPMVSDAVDLLRCGRYARLPRR